MDKPKEDNVTVTSSSFDQMLPRWDRTNAVLGGTDALRNAGETYLPKHEGEEPRRYYERLHSNVLFNFSELTLGSWVGRAFAQPIEFSDDFSQEVLPLTDDIDLQGNALDIVARAWFRDGVAKAFSHVLVEHPRIDRAGRTAADDLRENVRPYWVLIPPENLTFAETARINGREVLTHVRIKEEVVGRDGWAETSFVQYRVLDRVLVQVRTDGSIAPEDEQIGLLDYRVRVQIWREAVLGDKKKSQTEWAIAEEFFMDIDEIPLVTFYSAKDGLMLGKSPLLDQIDLNVRHWQSTSDQIAILTVARFPILAGSGVDQETKEGEQVIGPYHGLFTTDPTGRFYYVEHTGAAIAAGETELKNIEERGKSYGAEFMKVRPSRETATARLQDSSEATSPLQDAIGRFNDALQTAFWYTAKWMGVELAGTVKLPDTLSADAAEAETKDNEPAAQ